MKGAALKPAAATKTPAYKSVSSKSLYYWNGGTTTWVTVGSPRAFSCGTHDHRQAYVHRRGTAVAVGGTAVGGGIRIEACDGVRARARPLRASFCPPLLCPFFALTLIPPPTPNIISEMSHVFRIRGGAWPAMLIWASRAGTRPLRRAQRPST